ncbi:MAG: ADP-ribosylglycohydrolase family protein [Labilibaculum sp.]|nr:ADP-ribosylglycohydrolase family protein [Labilibaculum sp.]MBI9060231.1 ADP-ribosylglycohydrolase family protein [Labilibaculum sp.]
MIRENSRMKKGVILSSVVMIAILLMSCGSKKDVRKISIEEYRSKMKAGWLGQMAGVGWGAPTEFKFNAMIIPEDKVPEWKPNMLNQQYQDDIYVEMTFLKTLEDYGFDVSIRQAGLNFANSQYQLWHANKYGRDNLRAGIAPPYSGHPKYNAHADDIDYQIEADYSGLIAPGMPQTVIDLGEKFGRIMNYGDGVYGGQFVGAMYAEAFFETNIYKIIQAGLACIPAESQFAEAVNDVIKWHKENPKDWQKNWQLIEDKYNLNHDYRKFSCNGTEPNFNIDAKINGAYIVMGLLYGEGDMDKTIVVSMRCGMDSDCNPSNAAGILATSYGMENLPAKYKTGIDDTTKFSYTAYNFPMLLDVCEKLTKDAVVRAGGKVDNNSLVIPVQIPIVSPLEQSWDTPEPVGEINFTEKEMEQIVVKFRLPEDFVNTWKISKPFTKKGVNDMGLMDLKFDPETNKNYSDWKEVSVGSVGYTSGVVNILDLYANNNSVAYLKTRIKVDKAQETRFEIGSDDGVKVWVNGEVVHTNKINRGHNQGEDVVNVKLKKGWNDILMKVTQGTGGWEASLVITDLKGNPINTK